MSRRPRPLPVLRHAPGHLGTHIVVRTEVWRLIEERDEGRSDRFRDGTMPLVLNVGSASVELHGDLVNFDIRPKPGVHAVGDAVDLPFADDRFDVVAMSAVLQYCTDPRRAVAEAVRVLRPSGLLYIDAPFIQPVCEDGPDLFRFTAAGLRSLCDGLEDVEVGPSIVGAPALGFYVMNLLDVGNRYVSFALRFFASIPLALFASTQFNRRESVAGAFWLKARKPGRADVWKGNGDE